jgi:glycosyltransferase involved in cell wall biosynthesis
MTYNHAAFIEEALQGIWMQKTDFPIEVVIGDDFSTDGTLEIIEDFCTNHQRDNLHWNILNRVPGGEYHREREKHGRLYNFIDILNNCRGKYIALLDGDDYWTDPYKLQKQVDFLEGNADFVAHTHNVYFMDERISGGSQKCFRSSPSRVLSWTDIFPKRSFHTASITFRNNLHSNPCYKHLTNFRSGDKFLNGLLMLQGRIYYDSEPWAVYRRHATGESTSNRLGAYMKSDIRMIDFFWKRSSDMTGETRKESIRYFRLKRISYCSENMMKFQLIDAYWSLLIDYFYGTSDINWMYVKHYTKVLLYALVGQRYKA